jgi:hypothetical protein
MSSEWKLIAASINDVMFRLLHHLYHQSFNYMESTTLEDYVGGLNHIYIQNIYSVESK